MGWNGSSVSPSFSILTYIHTYIHICAHVHTSEYVHQESKITLHVWNVLGRRGKDQYQIPTVCKGFPGGASGKESACQCSRCKRCGFHLWVGKIPRRRAWQPTPVFLPGESHGQRSLVGYGPQGHKESDMTEATDHACTVCKAPCQTSGWFQEASFGETDVASLQPHPDTMKETNLICPPQHL